MPEDVLSRDAKLSEGDKADSELNIQAEEQPSPYDRWRNYQPASLSRPESVDPLDLLSEPVTPIAPPLGIATAPEVSTSSDTISSQPPVQYAGENNVWSLHATEQAESAAFAADSSGVHSAPVHPVIKEPRRSPFVAEDEMRAVYTGALKSASGDADFPQSEADTSDNAGLTTPGATSAQYVDVPNPAISAPATPVPAALKSQAFAAEELKPNVLSTDWVNKDGIDVAPSRKLDTPDMLRWRAEMLLDEMMVGAVDSSAGEGASTRRTMPFDEAAMLDDHPRRESRPESSTHTVSAAAGATANGVGATNTLDTQNGTGDPANATSVVSASVRAALPPRAVTRMPVPIVRDSAGSVDASGNGNVAGNSYSANGHSGGNGIQSSYANGNGANGHTGYTLEPAEYEVADDGRPTNSGAPAIDRGAYSESPSRNPAPAPTGSTGFILASQQEVDTPDSAAQAPSGSGLHSVDPLDHLGVHTPDVYSSAPTVETQRRAPTRTNGAPAAAPSSLTHSQASSMVSPVDGRYPSANGQRESEQTTRKLTAVEKRYPRSAPADSEGQRAGQGVPVDFAASGAHNDAFDDFGASYTSGLGPVRINPAVINSASITGAMSVGSRASSRYASLLPRATPWDLHEMEREIVSLQEEMARVLPSGHETSRRAHHLLEKAQSIFNGDPLRSAEVDYYLTQVRAIVQRSRQTMQWSELYRHQLGRYHLAWIVFSSLMLMLGLVFAGQLSSWAVALFGLNPNGMIGAYVAPAVVTMFAGSLGASIGAILNIRRYHRLNLGYFDRKYSLRGLMLPIIGLLGGVAIFAIFGSIYWAMGAESPLPIGLELFPAILAFALGFLQESIYGTRD